MDDCILTWCKWKALPTPELMEWRESIRIEPDRRIDMTQKELYGNDFQNFGMKQSLTELGSKYVLVPVNKATGNVSIICRRFYDLTMIKKLELDRDTKNDTNNT